jgi:hypothetical protein
MFVQNFRYNACIVHEMEYFRSMQLIDLMKPAAAL